MIGEIAIATSGEWKRIAPSLENSGLHSAIELWMSLSTPSAGFELISEKSQKDLMVNLLRHLNPYEPFLEQQTDKVLDYLNQIYMIYVGDLN